MCLYIIITIMLWLISLSIYSFIKHFTIVMLCLPNSLVIYVNKSSLVKTAPSVNQHDRWMCMTADWLIVYVWGSVCTIVT